MDQFHQLMEKLIACCGLNCAACDARIATISNDYQLLVETTEKWKKQFNASGLTPEMVKCTGCREEGPKMSHCAFCEIRKCVQTKNFQTCAECDQLETCEMVGKIFNYDPAALENLRSLQGRN